jgi:hypothetical protein
MSEIEILRAQMSRAFQLHRREENLCGDWAITVQAAAVDMPLIGRICAAYKLANAGVDAAGNSMWTGFMRENTAIHEALVSGNQSALAAIFANPGASNLFMGFDNTYAGALSWIKAGDGGKAWLRPVMT